MPYFLQETPIDCLCWIRSRTLIWKDIVLVDEFQKMKHMVDYAIQIEIQSLCRSFLYANMGYCSKAVGRDVFCWRRSMRKWCREKDGWKHYKSFSVATTGGAALWALEMVYCVLGICKYEQATEDTRTQIALQLPKTIRRCYQSDCQYE